MRNWIINFIAATIGVDVALKADLLAIFAFFGRTWNCRSTIERDETISLVIPDKSSSLLKRPECPSIDRPFANTKLPCIINWLSSRVYSKQSLIDSPFFGRLPVVSARTKNPSRKWLLEKSKSINLHQKWLSEADKSRLVEHSHAKCVISDVSDVCPINHANYDMSSHL